MARAGFASTVTPTRPVVVALALCLLGVVSAVAGRQSPGGIVSEFTKGSQALRQKDYATAVQHLGAALDLAPSHPGIMAQLARAEFLAGRRRPALDRLARAIALGGGLDVAADPAMEALVSGEDAAGLRAAIAGLRSSKATSEAAFRVAERDLIAEGIAFDPVDKAFYLGSIYRRKIVRVDASRRASEFARSKQDGLLAVLGMKVDVGRRLLWAATYGSEDMVDATPGELGRAALMQYDLRTGRLVKKFEVQPDPGRHLFNDVAIDGRGNVFVTDSEAGSLYVVRADADRLERLAGPGAWEYPNGIALSRDETRLFVAHLAGIAAFDIARGRSVRLSHPDNVTLSDVDGLYRAGTNLVAIQNGLNPPRVVRFDLAASEDAVTGIGILERGHPLFASIPTTGVLVDGWFYYIANSQLGAFDAAHKILPIEKLQETVVLRTRVAR